MADTSIREHISAEEIRTILSGGERNDVRARLSSAERTLDDVKKMLSSALFLNHGSLLAGNIEYAAFRIETLSLIFRIAEETFVRNARDGSKSFERFLRDLGAEVGFTFARDLLNRVVDADLFLSASDPRTLIDLWMSYENDTGSGTTQLKELTDQKIVIQIDDNPLRVVEGRQHSHCGFYKYYIRSLLNELLGSRARILQKKVAGANIRARRVFEVEEKPDATDSCVFIASLRDERLVRAFDALHNAYNLFYETHPSQDYSPCMVEARAALYLGQAEALGIEPEEAASLRGIYQVFKGVLSKDTYTKMHESYQSASGYIHKESQKKRLDKSHCRELLRDVRRVLVDLELSDLSSQQQKELVNRANRLGRVGEVERLLKESEALNEAQKRELMGTLRQVIEGPLEEAQQSKLLGMLQKAGGKAWDVMRPVLSEIIAEALKKQYGL